MENNQYPTEMYHAAIKILENRSEQLGDDELAHYGTPRHSGRYPYGSGKRPYQNSKEQVYINKTIDSVKNTPIMQDLINKRIPFDDFYVRHTIWEDKNYNDGLIKLYGEDFTRAQEIPYEDAVEKAITKWLKDNGVHY
ncbi:MAG: hypothetical protein J6U54_09755 [Clostridiales bacterium]|nr:hypothetical protein [Clostridiales bacterium]